MSGRGVAEEQQRPVALELIHHDFLAVLIDQTQRWQATVLRQQHDTRVEQRRRITLAFAAEHLVDGKPQHQGHDSDKNKNRCVGARHEGP